MSVENGGDGLEPIDEVATVSPPPSDDDGSALLDEVLGEVVDGAGDEGKPPRDPSGRFAKREGDPQQQESGASDPAAAEPAASQSQEQQQAAPKYEPPAEWDDAIKAEFNALDEKGKDLLLRQHKAFASYGERVQSFVDVAQPLIDVVQGASEYFNRRSAELNIAPTDIIRNLAATENTLRYGTYADKVATFERMARDYGIPVQIVSDPLADPTEPGGSKYAELHDLQVQLEIERNKNAVYQRRAETEMSFQLKSQIESFASEREPNGELKRPFIEQVKGTMGQLIANGSARTLDDAYRMAAAPIEQAIAKQLQAANDAQRRRQEEAVKKAKRATPVHVTGSPRGGGASESLDDILASVIQ